MRAVVRLCAPDEAHIPQEVRQKYCSVGQSLDVKSFWATKIDQILQG